MAGWKLRLLMLMTVWMLVQGRCLAQAHDGAAVRPPPDSADQPRSAASAPSRGGSPTPYRPPIAVPSAAGAITPLHVPTPTVTVTPPPAPRFAGPCDSAGCWGSDGTRYNAIGGALVRPDGRMCQNIGGVIQCP